MAYPPPAPTRLPLSIGTGTGAEGKMHKESGESREGGLSLPSPFSLLSLFTHVFGAGTAAGTVPGIWGGVVWPFL